MTIPIDKPQPFLRFTIIITFLLLAIRPNTPVQAEAIVFVSPAGGGTDCDQDSPCDLATGLTNVDAGGSLYAAAGNYFGAGDQVVRLDKTINFFGGWNGATVGPVVRDPAAYESILDGQDSRRVITITGISSVSPVIDGWTITGGNASTAVPDLECPTPMGAGYGCGGGIYVKTAEPEITHNNIRDNIASDMAAGSGAGGGIFVWESFGTIIRWNLIHNNDSHINFTGVGGGIAVDSSGGKTSILDNEIFENEDSSTSYASHQGAGIYITGSAIQVFNNSIHDNDPDNFSSMGSAIFAYSCGNALLIDENSITNNLGDSALVLAYSLGTIQQNTIINPDAIEGIRIGGKYPGSSDPAGIYNNIVAGHADNNITIIGFNSNLVHVHLIHNTLSDAVNGLNVEADASVDFDRGIVSDHSLGIAISADPEISLTVSNTLFHGNTVDGVMGSNPLSGDPLFYFPTGGNYHIRRGSAAIDRVTDGGIAKDIDDDDRPMGSSTTPFDVGADEYIYTHYFFLPSIRRP